MQTLDPIIRVPKPVNHIQAAYKNAVVYDDAPHPLHIEYDEWHLVWVAKFQISMSALKAAAGKSSRFPMNFRDELSEDEKYLISKRSQLPEVEWAIDNSFDGIYIKRWEEDVYMRYMLGVYLHSKQATYWKLKYGK